MNDKFYQRQNVEIDENPIIYVGTYVSLETTQKRKNEW
jgi:hypothetical protein